MFEVTVYAINGRIGILACPRTDRDAYSTVVYYPPADS